MLFVLLENYVYICQELKFIKSLNKKNMSNSSNSSSSSSSSGISLLGVLGVVFVVLKLTDHIDWSWFYVTMPFWSGPVVFFIILFIVYFFKLMLKIINY